MRTCRRPGAASIKVVVVVEVVLIVVVVVVVVALAGGLVPQALRVERLYAQRFAAQPAQ